MLAPDRLHEYAVRASEATGWDECEGIIREAIAAATIELSAALAEALAKGRLGRLYGSDIDRLDRVLEGK